MQATVEEILWTIFTSYSLSGNHRDPSKLNGTGLLKLARDSKIFLASIIL